MKSCAISNATSVNIYIWNSPDDNYATEAIQEITGKGFIFTHFVNVPTPLLPDPLPFLIIGSSCTNESAIYKWNGTLFDFYQNIDISFTPSDIDSFVVKFPSDDVLSLLCLSNPSGDSSILKWNPSSLYFEYSIDFSTNHSNSCSFLEVSSLYDAARNTLLYVAFANDIFVDIYQFDILQGKFNTTTFQRIITEGITLQIEHVKILEQDYLDVNTTLGDIPTTASDYMAVLIENQNSSRICNTYEWDRITSQFDFMPDQTLTIESESNNATLGYILFVRLQYAYNYLLLVDSGLNSNQTTIYSWNGNRFTHPVILDIDIDESSQLLQADYIFIDGYRNVTYIYTDFEKDFNGLVFANSASGESPIIQLYGDCLTGCSAHGTCVSDSFDCVCNGQYTGLDCSLLNCPNDCSGHGTCDTHTGICSCFYGWEGSSCNFETQLISSSAITSISRSLTVGVPLINLEVPFSSNTFNINDTTVPLDYWFIVKHDLLLWKQWEDITTFSFGLLYLSVDMVTATFTRNFSSELLDEQVQELGSTLTTVVDDAGMSNSYKVCHLAQDYDVSGQILCCQNNEMEYISTCDFVLEQSEMYINVNTAVALSIYLSLCVMILIIFASSKPFLLASPVLYSDDSIPVQFEAISKKHSFLVFFPVKLTLCFLIVELEFLVLSIFVKPNDAPGVYGYYQSFDNFFASQTSIMIVTIVFGLIGFMGLIGWLFFSIWGLFHRLKKNKMDQDFFLQTIDGDADPENATIPLRPEMDSIIHPLLYDISRKLCNKLSPKATKKHRNVTNVVTFSIILLAYSVFWILPCYLIFIFLAPDTWINWVLFGIGIIVFTAYLVTHWRACDIRRDRRYVRQWAVSLMPEESKTYSMIFIFIYLICWIGGLAATITSMLTVVRNISEVILAISINAYSYTIVAFFLGFLILVRSELMRALYPFETAKQVLLEWGTNFSAKRYHDILRFLNVHMSRLFIEAIVKSILLSGVLFTAFVAITSVSESLLSDTLIVLFTTLIPIVSGMVTYIRQVPELEKAAFKSAVLKVSPHPELFSRKEKNHEYDALDARTSSELLSPINEYNE